MHDSSRITVTLVLSASIACGEYDPPTGVREDAPGMKDEVGAPVRGRQAAELRFADCTAQLGVFPIDAAAVAEHLPPGFEPVPFQDGSPDGATGLPAPAGATASVQLIAFSCVLDGAPAKSPEPVRIAQAWIYVDPPDAFEEELGCAPDEVEGDCLGPTPSPYVVVPWTVVTNARAADVLSFWGLPASVGEVSNEIRALAPGASQIGTVDADDGGSVVRLTTVVPHPNGETTPEHLRFFGVTGGQLTGVVDSIEEPHTHSELGTSALMLQSGEPGFPLPTTPGVSLHIGPGHAMNWIPVAFLTTTPAADAASDGELCGDGTCLPPLENDFSCPADCGSPDECEPDECVAGGGNCLPYVAESLASPGDASLQPEQCIASGGNCHCDDECAFFGDCCSNACDVCGSCGTVCGDGLCAAGEDPSSCAEDCALCGDGVCTPVIEEDVNYCPVDCG